MIDRVITIRHSRCSPASYTRHILPDTTANIILLHGNQADTQRDGYTLKLSGQFPQVRQLAFSTAYQGFILKLKPWALGALLKEPASQLINKSVQLQDLIRAGEYAQLQQQLAAGTKPLDVLVAYLGSKLTTAHHLDSLVVKAIHLLESSREPAMVSRLAAELHTCTRNFERRFKAQTGLTPKQYIRNLRFSRAHALLAGGRPLLDVTHCCGYFDQTHFTKEFRAMSGLTPRAFQQNRLSLFY